MIECVRQLRSANKLLDVVILVDVFGSGGGYFLVSNVGIFLLFRFRLDQPDAQIFGNNCMTHLCFFK